ncbi:zinc ABC transporter substrate-binding protein AdcA [Enterococcus malodoratus]|uniref:zinc ABC transporter substrate-binding protein AdcA n=1 Tax=Enterococcus malodoratus TaxID=71451 RepID=UPI002073D2C8|nr:zinc ABC transporter substrate-binding protein AdcA [Enterococcus malodoratus]
MKKKFVIALISLLALVGLGACKSNQAATKGKDEKLQIVATFYPMYDFTKNIVGDAGDVSLLIPAGSEPHDYEPSAKDMAKITEADAFVYHNENMETWVPRAAKSWKKGSPNVIEGTKDMLLLPGGEEEEHDHDHGDEKGHHHELDPHTWLSPHRAIKEVTSIKDQLVKLYPKKKDVFEANAKKYLAKLEALDKNYSDTLKDAKQKNFVTQHTAFRYLALDYGLNQVGIAGINPDQEPDPSRIAKLKHYVEDNEIKYIYFENNNQGKTAKTLADETKVQLEVLNPIESLTNKQIDAGESYLSVMKENLMALKKTTSVPGKDVKPEEDTATEQTVYNGYFKDSEVKARKLSDYAGNWQSVYPLLKNGTLDQVFDYKAKLNKDKTAEEYKTYYETGYQTKVDKIKITNNQIDFMVDGKHHKYTYEYAGSKILTYEKGNRGVRFTFETKDPDAGEFKYVQFNDHGIAPAKAAHFHIYTGGESQKALYDEMNHWPTYYPTTMKSHEIAQEMLAH